MFEQIATGVGAALMYSLSAFFKKQNTTFDWSKFGVTVIVGAVAGMVMAFTDLDAGTATNFVIMAGTVPIAENLLKIAKRRLWDKYIAG